MRTLFIISMGMDKPSDEEIKRLEEADLFPRDSLLEEKISAVVLDERFLESAPRIRKILYKFLPVYLCQIIEAFFVHKQYDAILSFYEKAGLPLALLQKITASKVPHVFMSSWLSAPQKKWFLKRVHSTLSRIILWSSVQKQVAIEEIGIPEEKIKLINYGIDHKFWRPMPSDIDIISAAGMEMRDYPTLIEAIRPLNIPCHIATGTSRGALFETVKKLYEIDDLPAHVLVEKKSYTDLRAMYARSKFVVIPLLETDTDNGITVMLEAMAMGKTVICTRVEGQKDVLQDGVTGLYVPQGDPEALRKSIVTLWESPERCKVMGAAAREHVLKHHNIELFTDAIANEIYSHLKKDALKTESLHSYADYTT